MAVFRHFAEAYGRRTDPFQVRFLSAPQCKARRMHSCKGQEELAAGKESQKTKKPVDACGYLDHSQKYICPQAAETRNG